MISVWLWATGCLAVAAFAEEETHLHALGHERTLLIKDNLYDVSAAGMNVWAVGGFGSIYRSDDGGRTWTAQTSGTTEHLFGVDMADARVGWIVGRSGTILKTEDGGTKWTPQKAVKPRHLFEVSAIDAQHAVAIGDWGTIFTTADGGASWQDHTLEEDLILNGQSWVDVNHGWIAAEQGRVLSTADGGANWTSLETGLQKTLFGIHFNNLQDGWVVGLDGLIVATNDGGQTWNTLHGEADLGGLEQLGSHAGTANPHLYDIAVSGNRGYAVGDNSSVFTSRDGGRTWELVPVPVGSDLRWLRSVALTDERSGVVVGAHGLVLGWNDSDQGGLGIWNGSE